MTAAVDRKHRALVLALSCAGAQMLIAAAILEMLAG